MNCNKELYTEYNNLLNNILITNDYNNNYNLIIQNIKNKYSELFIIDKYNDDIILLEKLFKYNRINRLKSNFKIIYKSNKDLDKYFFIFNDMKNNFKNIFQSIENKNNYLNINNDELNINYIKLNECVSNYFFIIEKIKLNIKVILELYPKYNEFAFQILMNKHEELSNLPSDINEHLPTLCKYASECNSVIECGIRSVVSSWSILYGLSLNNNNNKKKYLLNDITECQVYELIDKNYDSKIKIKYKWINDLDLVIDKNYDMIFIDTWHIYGHLKRELNKFAPNINKYIILHDTTVDEEFGETIRMGFDPVKQSEECGYPIEEITKGIWPAVEEFINENPNWIIKERYTNNNGLTILEKINYFNIY